MIMLYTKRKMSIAHLSEKVRKARFEKLAKAIYQLDKETKEIIKEWRCAKFAAEELHLNQGNINECCRGKRKTCGGYIWIFKTNQERR